MPQTNNTSGATSTGEPATVCGYAFGRGVWYTVTPPYNARITISTCGSSFDTMLAVYADGCGLPGEVECSNGSNPFGCGAGRRAGVSFDGVANVTYYILVGGYQGAGGDLHIVANLPPPPANDTCAGAIELTPGVQLPLNTTNATDFGEPAKVCNDTFGRGVWFTVRTTNNSRVNLSTCESSFATLMSVYTNGCGALSEVTCSDGHNPFGCGIGNRAGVSFSSLSNVTYYVLVGGFLGASGDLRIVADLTPPPANDMCAGAIELVPDVPQTVSTTNATEFGDPATLCNGFQIERGVWYTVKATNNARVNINTCGSGFSTLLSVYTNGCGALSNVTCSTGHDAFSCGSGPYWAGVSFDGLSNTTYYVLAGSSGGSGGDLWIVADLTPTPANDTCAGAIELTPGVLQTTGTTNATDFGEPVSLRGSLGRGIWYKVTPTNNTRLNLTTCGSSFDTRLAVFTNGCGALSNVPCSSAYCNPFSCAGGISFSSLSNTTYYILVGGYQGAAGNLQIVADLTPPPPNDTCAGAIELFSGVPQSLSTTNATEFGEPATFCNYQFGRGVWFTLRTTNNSRVNFSTCGSSFATMMSVYTNACGALSYVTCSVGDNSFGCGNGRAGVSFSSFSNITYYVLVGGYQGAGGDLRIAADLSSPPSNDTCAGAIELTPGVPQFVSTTNATEFGEPATLCGVSFGRGVWFTLTPTANEQVNLSTCGSSFNTMLAVYTNGCGALSNVTCSSGTNPFCIGGQAGVSFSGLANATYYILVGGKSGAGGSLQIQSGIVDLTPVSLTVTGSTGGLPVAGKSLTGKWRVTNQGNTALNGNWTDRLSLSNVATHAVQVLREFAGPHPAQAGGFYTNDINQTMPPVAAGNYVFIAEVDANHQLIETNENNNLLTLALSVTNQPPAIALLSPPGSVQLTSCVPSLLSFSAAVTLGSYAVTNVGYYDGAVLVASSTNSADTVRPALLDHGDHFITAQAIDLFGLKATSQPPATVSVRWPDQLHILRADLFASNCVICMRALNGSNYVTETATNLRPAVVWQPQVTNQVAGSILAVTNSTIGPMKYFRAKLLP